MSDDTVVLHRKQGRFPETVITGEHDAPAYESQGYTRANQGEAPMIEIETFKNRSKFSWKAVVLSIVIGGLSGAVGATLARVLIG